MLPRIDREVPLPRVLDRHDRMIGFANELNGVGYDLAHSPNASGYGRALVWTSGKTCARIGSPARKTPSTI
jgi:hypothetical protein